MKRAPLAANEAERLERLRRYEILDTLPEKEFQEVVELASLICNTPISLISLLDHDRQWFKARRGIEAEQTARDISFCGHAIHESETFVVPDATRDERFADNPLVTGPAQIRFYAGAKLVSGEGLALGTLCVIDTQPRELSPEQRRALDLLAAQVVRLMDARLLNRKLEETLGSLSASEEKFREIADHIDGCFWTFDLATKKAVYVSSGAERIFGLTPERMGDFDAFCRVVVPEDRAKVQRILQMPLPDQGTTEYRVLRTDGELRHIRDKVYPVRDASGAIRRLCGIAVDITEEVRSTREAEENRAKLVQASKMSALGEMSAGIAHEINNPLAIIIGKAHKLKTLVQANSHDADQLLEIGTKVEATALRISKIVHALLHFARDGHNGITQAHPVQGLVNDALTLCAQRFRQNSVRFTVKLPSEPCLLQCRPVELTQVLLNLLNNGYDAVSGMADKWIELEVRADQGRLLLSVSDGGCGVPAEVAGRVFDPFFTTKEPGKGTGIGLSLSKGIVEAHGGTLTLDRSVPHTRFVVSLPLTLPMRSAA